MSVKNVSIFSNAIENAFESEDGSDIEDGLDDSKTLTGNYNRSLNIMAIIIDHLLP
jgi:hypothetical protein